MSGPKETTQPLPRGRILRGDVRRVLPTLPAASVDCIVTSPPYFRLRDYGEPGQLGEEQHVDAWARNLLGVADELARVLTPTGTLWLNLGDSYSAHLREGAPRKSLLLGPERLALSLIGRGWLLRNKIVWSKPSVMPTSVRDRLRSSWEIVYVLSRQPDYFFDLDAIRLPHVSSAKPRERPTVNDAARGPNAAGTAGLAALKAAGLPGHPLGKNPGDVWHLSTSSYRGGVHPAMFPAALAERAIRAGCPERRCSRCRRPQHRPLHLTIGDAVTRGELRPSCDCGAPNEPGIVLDPFIGSGTTAIAAEAQHRDWLGIELSARYAASAEQRIAAARVARAKGRRPAA